MKKIAIQTKKKREIIDITDLAEAELVKLGEKDGVCHLFITHTTAALTTADLDPGTDLDMLDAFETMIPPHQSEARYRASLGIHYRHPHNPSHVGDHIMASLIGASVSIPFENSKFILGMWQRVVLVELDGPRERELILSVTPTRIG